LKLKIDNIGFIHGLWWFHVEKKALDGFTGLPPGNFIIAIESPMYL
jgi:hypothetical protein